MALVFSLLYQVVIFFIFMAIQVPTAVFKRKPPRSKQNEDTTLNTETSRIPQPRLSKVILILTMWPIYTPNPFQACISFIASNSNKWICFTNIVFAEMLQLISLDWAQVFSATLFLLSNLGFVRKGILSSVAAALWQKNMWKRSNIKTMLGKEGKTEKSARLGR